MIEFDMASIATEALESIFGAFKTFAAATGNRLSVYIAQIAAVELDRRGAAGNQNSGWIFLTLPIGESTDDQIVAAAALLGAALEQIADKRSPSADFLGFLLLQIQDAMETFKAAVLN
jgi:hypothetical protein